MRLRATYKLADLFGRIAAAARQVTHFTCHYRKAASLFTCTGRFNGGVQRQNVSLEGNAVNHAQNVGDTAGTVGYVAHLLNDVADHFTTAIGSIRDRLRQLMRLVGVIRILFHRGGDLFHAGSGLFQRRCR